jgi:two-component system phosphate regulon sensor histidine kinase PhoR
VNALLASLLWSALAIACLVFAPLAIAYGVVWGLAAVIVCLIAMLAWQLVHLRQLLDWLQGPLNAAVPRGRGVWEIAFAGLHRRIRIRRSQQDELAGNFARFRRAVEALPDAIIAIDRHRHIEWLNERAELLFAISGEQDAGQALTNLIRHPDFVAYLDRGDFDEPLIYRGGRVEGVTLMVQIVAYGENQSLVVARDISQIERTETMRRDFIANVSHELKTPLTVVAGFSEVLADNYKTLAEPEIARYLELICEQNQRMQRLIADLLTLSTLESGSPAPSDERVDLEALLKSIVADARVLSAGQHEITLSVDSPRRPVQLLGAANELRSAFANLVANAVRYTPAGGRIDLAWRSVAGGGGACEFVVADTGIGIAAQHLPRLTERFYRVDKSRSRETGGTGLGLAIVKHVLTRHRARLEIESEVGKGSRFIVHWPASAIVAAEVAAQAC